MTCQLSISCRVHVWVVLAIRQIISRVPPWKRVLRTVLWCEMVRIFNHLRYGTVRTVILLKVCIKHNMLVRNLHSDIRKWKDAR